MIRTYNRRELPADFAQKILDSQIEIKLVQVPSKEVICKFVELLTLGVEYYESIKSYKYLYFEKRMAEIFSQAMAEPLDKPQTSLQSPKDQQQNDEQKLASLKLQDKQKKMLMTVIERSAVTATGKEVKKLLDSSDNKRTALQNRLQSQISNQNKLLQQKIMQRREKLVTKSFSTFDLQDAIETRESLFMESPSPAAKRKVDPLVVNFENLINESDQEEKDDFQMRMRKFSIGKVTSMCNLHSTEQTKRDK